MNILVIEDDILKAKQVESFLKSLGACFIDRKSSYTSGLLAIRKDSYELCILDMSLPTFDITPQDQGYEPLAYGGELLLCEMKRLKREIPTLVLTQFTTFPMKLGAVKTLAELDKELEEKYASNYLGCVFYADEETTWQTGVEREFKRAKK